VVRLVPERKLKPTIRALYGNDKAKRIQQALNPECLSGIGKDERFRIRRAEAILPIDAGDFTFYDCAYEEMLQALGAINDDASVPWTMFNDDVQMGFFDVYDQYILNILYDPRVRPGMTRPDVEKLLPDILPNIHRWISRIQSVRRLGAGADDLMQKSATYGAVLASFDREPPQSGAVPASGDALSVYSPASPVLRRMIHADVQDR